MTPVRIVSARPQGTARIRLDGWPMGRTIRTGSVAERPAPRWPFRLGDAIVGEAVLTDGVRLFNERDSYGVEFDLALLIEDPSLDRVLVDLFGFEVIQ